jgi:hypothetical protein
MEISTTCSESAPLHAVQIGRETLQQLPGWFDELFHVLCEIQYQLAAADSIPSLMDIIVGPFCGPSSYQSVMVYELDETAAGFVASKIMDSRTSRNLHKK